MAQISLKKDLTMPSPYSTENVYSSSFGKSVNIANTAGKQRIFAAQSTPNPRARHLGDSGALASTISRGRKSFRETPRGYSANRYTETHTETIVRPDAFKKAGTVAADALVAGGLCVAVGVAAPVAFTLRFATRVGIPAGERALRELDNWTRNQLPETLSRFSQMSAETLAPSRLAGSSAFCASLCLVSILNSRPRIVEAMVPKANACWSAPLSETDECRRLAIEEFLRDRTKEKNPRTLSEILVRETKHPIELAAILKMETNGVAGLVGSSGEVSKWQLMRFHLPKRFNPYNDEQAAKKADNVLDGTIKRSGGAVWHGMRRYNGRGPRAIAYATKGWSYVKIIKHRAKEIRMAMIQQREAVQADG